MQKCPRLFLRVVHCDGRPRAASSGCAVKVHLQVSSRYDISHRNSPSWSSGGALWRQATRQPPASSSGCAMKVHLQLSSRCVMSHRNAPSWSSGWCIVKADLRPAPSFFLRMCDEGVPPVIFQVCHVTQKCSQSFLRMVHCDDMPHASSQPLLVGVPWRCTSSLLGASYLTALPLVVPHSGALWRQASRQPLLVGVPWRCTSRLSSRRVIMPKCPRLVPRVVHCEDRLHARPQPLLVGVSWRCTSRLPPSRVVSCRKAHSWSYGWCIVKAGLTPALLVVCHGMSWRSTSSLSLGAMSWWYQF